MREYNSRRSLQVAAGLKTLSATLALNLHVRPFEAR
jgi:hypothetical protein